MGDSSMRVSEELLDELYERKQRGESYEDVIWRLLEEEDEKEPAPEPEPNTRTHTRDESDDVGDVDLEIPGSGWAREQREEAILEMRDRLRELGRAEKDDLLEVVDPDDVGYASLGSFWSNCIKGKDTLRALPNVEPPEEGGRVWRYVG